MLCMALIKLLMRGLPNLAIWFLSRVSLLANMTPHFYSLDPLVISLILPYVDDMIITFDNIVGICALQQFLNQHFEMKDLGTLSYFFGL